MMRYNIAADQEQLKAAQKLVNFIVDNSTDATRTAVNKTARRMKIVSRKEIQKDIRLELSYINKRLTVKGARKGQQTAKITTPSRGLRLTKFSTDESIAAEGVSWIKPPIEYTRRKDQASSDFSVQIKPGGSVKDVKGKPNKSEPFIIVGKGSRALILVQRKPDGKMDALYGPSLSQVFSSVRERIIPDAEKELKKQMNDAINALIKQQHPTEEEPGVPAA